MAPIKAPVLLVVKLFVGTVETYGSERVLLDPLAFGITQWAGQGADCGPGPQNHLRLWLYCTLMVTAGPGIHAEVILMDAGPFVPAGTWKSTR